jgi:hypothetical protein
VKLDDWVFSRRARENVRTTASSHGLSKESITARLKVGLIVFAGALLLLGAAGRALAQVTPVDPAKVRKILPGDTEEWGDLLPKGVVLRGEAVHGLQVYKPNPPQYPIPRTKWDSKPDLSAVWWPGVELGKPALLLDSIYKDGPEAKALRGRVLEAATHAALGGIRQ